MIGSSRLPKRKSHLHD